MNIISEKEQRCINANELIELIANTDRKFFNHLGSTNRQNQPGIISKFELKNNRIYFEDGYTRKKIYAYDTHKHYTKRVFTEGGTLKSLMFDLAKYIQTGEKANGRNGYGGVYCQHWGYTPEGMKLIQQKAKEIKFTT